MKRIAFALALLTLCVACMGAANAGDAKIRANEMRRTYTQSEALLALRYDFTFYSGGPHPWDTIAAQHYDLRTGAPVPLEALVKDPQAFQERVAHLIYQGLTAEDYSEFDGGDADPSQWPLEQGLLTDQGLRVFYQEGELGGTYAGPLEMLIPYPQLSGQFVDGLGIGSDGKPG